MCLLEHKVRKGCPPGVAAKGKREGDGKEEGYRGEGRERAIGKNRYNLPSANNRGLARSIHLRLDSRESVRHVCVFALHAD